MELIQPLKQRAWRWPAVANFSLGGMAASFYVLSTLLVILKVDRNAISNPFAYKIIAPAITSIGFFLLSMEAGRPARAPHLFRHQKRSWMSRETLFAVIFILVSVLDWLFLHTALSILASVAALGLLVSQSLIIYRSIAVTAWNMALAVILFTTSSFVMGSALLMMMPPLGPILMYYSLLIALFCVILDLMAWLLYVGWPYSTDIHNSTRALRRPYSLIFTAGIGHVIPLFFLIVLYIGLGGKIGNGVWGLYAFISGTAMIVGGVSLKTDIMLHAGYVRAIELGNPRL